MDLKKILTTTGALAAMVFLNACAAMKTVAHPSAILPSHRVAVLPFKGDARFSEEISAVLVSELLGHGFKVVERADLMDVINEQGLQYTGAMDPSTMAPNGKLCGADFIVIGSIHTRQVVKPVDWILGTGGAVTQVESVTFRWVSVRSGEVVASAQIRNSRFGNMSDMASRIVDSVSGAIENLAQAPDSSLRRA